MGHLWSSSGCEECEHTLTRMHANTQAAWQPTAGPRLYYWWRWLIKLWNWLSHMPPSSSSSTSSSLSSLVFWVKHNFFLFLYCRGETEDQSWLSATWQKGKSKGVIEKVSWPCGAVSVACLSGGGHWWTVEGESLAHALIHTHAKSLQETEAFPCFFFSPLPHRGTGSAAVCWPLSVYNNMLWGAYTVVKKRAVTPQLIINITLFTISSPMLCYAATEAYNGVT